MSYFLNQTLFSFCSFFKILRRWWGLFWDRVGFKLSEVIYGRWSCSSLFCYLCQCRRENKQGVHTLPFLPHPQAQFSLSISIVTDMWKETNGLFCPVTSLSLHLVQYSVPHSQDMCEALRHWMCHPLIHRSILPIQNERRKEDPVSTKQKELILLLLGNSLRCPWWKGVISLSMENTDTNQTHSCCTLPVTFALLRSREPFVSLSDQAPPPTLSYKITGFSCSQNAKKR